VSHDPQLDDRTYSGQWSIPKEEKKKKEEKEQKKVVVVVVV
jgi:hypothetical protein